VADRVPSSNAGLRAQLLADMSGKNFAFLLASLLAIGVCLTLALSQERPPTMGTSYEVFQAQRAAWASRRPATYAVSIKRGCFCRLWSVRVKIAGSEVESVEFLNNPSNPSDFADRRFYPRDVDSLFKIVDDAYTSRAYKIDLMFDDTFGYPTKAFIDRDRDTVDDEELFVLENFEAGVASAHVAQLNR
jgi:hypothetical protein